MKVLKAVGIVATACVAAAVGYLLVGCEVESASDSLVSISPTSASLTEGQSQEFVASGADSYQWSTDSDSYGHLSAKTGDRVTYTSTYSSGSGTVSVVLSVQGIIGGSTGGGTNSTESHWKAEAVISHKPAETGDLSVDPGSGMKLSDGEWQTYTASGGTGSYTWELSDSGSGVGFLSSASGESTIFTCDYAGTNTADKTIYLTCKSGTDDFKLTIILTP